jgi:hypothetical protein
MNDTKECLITRLNSTTQSKINPIIGTLFMIRARGNGKVVTTSADDDDVPSQIGVSIMHMQHQDPTLFIHKELLNVHVIDSCVVSTFKHWLRGNH